MNGDDFFKNNDLDLPPLEENLEINPEQNVEDVIPEQNTPELDENEKKKKLSYYFNKIDNFFKEKEQFIHSYKHIPIEDIFKNAPKYYGMIDLIEKFNIFISKNKDWLKLFVKSINIKFDFDSYERWKATKKFENFKYSITQVPSKWIHILQEYMIEILEYIQILLILEFYINETDYKAFLKDNPKLFFKLKANFKKPSPPSENLELIFETIDFLLNINMANNFPTNHVVDATLCIRVYRKIDNLKILDILKAKSFYIKYRHEYLKNVNYFQGSEIMYKDNIIKVAEDFLKAVDDMVFNFNEYKKRLIEKQQTFNRTNK